MEYTFKNAIFEAINDHTRFQALKLWSKEATFDSLDGTATMRIEVTVKLKTPIQKKNAKRRREFKYIERRSKD